MTTDEIETGPLKNTNAMKCIAVLLVGHSSNTQDMRLLFGRADASHDYILEADGTKVYVAFGTLAGTIDERATGNANNACWAIPDGTALPYKPTGGRETATGSATYCDYNVLHYKCATGSATGYLRIYRASLSRTQDAGEFRAP